MARADQLRKTTNGLLRYKVKGNVKDLK